jgi:hypothetical protein
MYGLLYECKFLTIEETNKKKSYYVIIKTTFFFKSKQKLFFVKFNIVKIAFKTVIESSQERKYERTIKK